MIRPLKMRVVRALHEMAERVASSRAPDFIVGGADDPYLRRWWLIPRNKLFNIYLHQFLRSDDDRALHDHPWVNCSILVAGEYIEHSILAGGVQRAVRRRAGDIKLRPPRSAHRIELIDASSIHAPDYRLPCWTIFITGPVQRTWGFHCPKGWRPWREFVDDRDSGKIGKGCAE